MLKHTDAFTFDLGKFVCCSFFLLLLMQDHFSRMKKTNLLLHYMKNNIFFRMCKCVVCVNMVKLGPSLNLFPNQLFFGEIHFIKKVAPVTIEVTTFT